MKKPKGYFGFAFGEPGSGYSKEYLNSTAGKKDIKREGKNKKKLLKHYKKHGWDPSETWNLDETIARFILPRLRHLRENTHGYPHDLTEEMWDDIMGKMVKSFELSLLEHGEDGYEEFDQEEMQEGLDLFAKHFRNLWD